MILEGIMNELLYGTGVKHEEWFGFGGSEEVRVP